MIIDPPLLKIRRRFARPDAAALAALAGVPTGFIVDAMDGAGALDSRIKPCSGAQTLLGAALTCAAGPADNLAVFGALSVAEPGDVVICSAEGYDRTAVTGDLLLGMLKNRGVTGFVTDGHVRDLAGIRAVGLPCFAGGVTPNSPARNGPGSVGLPIVVGGVAVAAGDIVAADEDGVVIVPAARIPQLLARLPQVKAAEAALDARVKAGLTIPDFLRTMIEAGRFEDTD